MSRTLKDIHFSTDNDIGDLTDKQRMKLLIQAYNDIKRLTGTVLRLQDVHNSGLQRHTINNPKLERALACVRPEDLETLS